MFKNRVKAGGLNALLLGSMIICAQPCTAAPDHRDLEYRERRTAAFAGTAFRLETGSRSTVPTARLQIGMRSISRSRQSAAPLDTQHVPALELGIGGRDKGALFIAGQPTREIERRLGVRGDTYTTVSIIGVVALVAVGLLVITNLNKLDTDNNNGSALPQ